MVTLCPTGTKRTSATTFYTDAQVFEPSSWGGDALSGLESASQLQTDGVYISRSYLADQPGERNAEFVTAYRSAYRNRVPDHRGATAYDIVHLLARAIDAVGTNRRAIRDYLAGVGTRSPEYDGVTGTISFDENGEVPNKQVVIGVVRADRLVTAPGQ